MKRLIFFLLLICLPLSIFANSRIINASCYEKDSMLYADVKSLIKIPQTIEQAIHSGLILFFEYNFEIKEKKWINFKAIAKLKKQYILSYHKLTDEYQIEDPVTYQVLTFKSLPAAINFMQKLQKFPLILSSQLTKEHKDKLALYVKFKLSAENLPTIVKLEKILSNRWKTDSDWTIWPIPYP